MPWVGKYSTPEEYLSTRHPLVDLVDQLLKKRELKHISVQGRDFSIALHQKAIPT